MEYRWNYQIQLRDTDAAGVVYFANFLTICHAAYEAALSAAEIDFKLLVGSSEIALPIVHASGDFKQPLYCGDQVQVCLNPSQINDSEFQIIYQLYSKEQKIAATVLTKHVSINLVDRRRTKLPDMIKNWLIG
jgi:1,4-dihydroxy-2-naphthoyl-CoA hydrolase